MQKARIDAAVVNDAARDLSMDYSVPQPVSPQKQVTRGVTGGLRPSPQSVYGRIRGMFLGHRLFQTSVLLVALSSLGIYWGTRTRPAIAQPADVRELKSADSSPARASETASARRDAAADGSTSQSIPKSDTGARAVRSFTYVVQPKDTLRELCVSMLGRYDNAVRAEIRQLNPNLKNPEHLDPGQEIRLPLSITN